MGIFQIKINGEFRDVGEALDKLDHFSVQFGDDVISLQAEMPLVHKLATAVDGVEENLKRMPALEIKVTGLGIAKKLLDTKLSGLAVSLQETTQRQQDDMVELNTFFSEALHEKFHEIEDSIREAREEHTIHDIASTKKKLETLQAAMTKNDKRLGKFKVGFIGLCLGTLTSILLAVLV